MRKLLAVAALAVFSAALAAQPEKLDTVKDGKFKAAFPAAPASVKKSAGGLTLTIFSSADDKAKGGYTVIYGDLPPESLKAPKPEQVLESAEKGLKDYFKATVNEKESKATTFGAKKYPARQVVAEKMDLSGEWNLRGTLVLVGNRLYQVYVYGPKDFLASKEADAFLASFEIVE